MKSFKKNIKKYQQGDQVPVAQRSRTASDLLQQVYQDRIKRNVDVLAPELASPTINKLMPAAQQQKLQQEYQKNKAARDTERAALMKEQNRVFFEQFGSNAKVRDEIMANYNQLVNQSTDIPELEEYKKYKQSLTYTDKYDASNPEALKLDCHGAQCYDQAKETGVPFNELMKYRAILKPGETYSDFYKAKDDRMKGQGKYLVDKGLADPVADPSQIQENDYVQYWKEKGGHNIKVQAALTDPDTGKKYFVMEGASPSVGYHNNLVYTDAELKALNPYAVRLKPQTPPADAQSALPQNQLGGLISDKMISEKDDYIFVPHTMVKKFQMGGTTPAPQGEPMEDPLKPTVDFDQYQMFVDDSLYRGEPNVEVESGEFMMLPNGVTHKVTGKKHSEGGEPMNAPGGSKVYSDHLKVSKAVTEMLGGKGKKKTTYANLAKQFDVGKYDKILADATDPITQATNNRMRDRNQRKLDLLFQIQQVHNGEAFKEPMQEQSMQPGMEQPGMEQMGMEQSAQGQMYAQMGKQIPLPNGLDANMAMDYKFARPYQAPVGGANYLPNPDNSQLVEPSYQANYLPNADTSALVDAPAQTPAIGSKPAKDYQPQFPWMQLAPAAFQIASNAQIQPGSLQQMNFNDTLSRLQNQNTQVDFSAAREQNQRDYQSALRASNNNPAMASQLLAQKLTANQGLAAQKFNTEQGLKNQQGQQLAELFQNRDRINTDLKQNYEGRVAQARSIQQQNIGNAMQSAGNVLGGFQQEKNAFNIAKQMYPNVNWTQGRNGPQASINGIDYYFDVKANQFMPLQYDKRQTKTKTDRQGRIVTEQTMTED